MPPIAFFKGKGESFFFFLPSEVPDNTHGDNLPAFASTFGGRCKTADCEGLSEVRSQVRPTLGPRNTHRTQLHLFYRAAGAGRKGGAIRSAYPPLQRGNGSGETEKLFQIASRFLRNNSKVDASPTFQPTRRFVADTGEMQALKKRIPSPTSPPHKASCWILSVTSATA